MRYRLNDPDERIIKSFLDTDFYKFTMGNFIFNDPELADAIVTFRLKCRTKNVKLGKTISTERLTRELDHAMNLRPTNSEIYYLRGMDVYGDRMFSEPYLQFLKTVQLPPYKLEIAPDGELNLEFTGPMKTVTYWELLGLSISNELYHRQSVDMAFSSERAKNRYLMTGLSRLMHKIEKLGQYKELSFSDFGTRRRASHQWQENVVELVSQQLPDQFRGTSNVYLAMKYDLIPTGTSAHELFMVAAGLADIKSGGDKNAIQDSQSRILNSWLDKYGYGLSIALTDTFGTKFTFENGSRDLATKWKGTRQDSGDPYRYGEKTIKWYEKHGVDPRNKMIVFSDGLTLETMIRLLKHFRGRIIPTFGWGTNLTNDFEPQPDMGLMPLSLVIKASSANGQGLVKLSDNIAKAMGAPEDIARYKKIFDYDESYFVPCTY